MGKRVKSSRLCPTCKQDLRRGPRPGPGGDCPQCGQGLPRAKGKEAGRCLQLFLDSLLVGLPIPAGERRALIPHIEGTPARVTRMYQEELLAGYWQVPQAILSVDFKDGYDEIVLIKDISFHSLCVHHLLPFYGKAHVAYLPKGRVVGLSKLARLVECYARRLQIQERMTEQIAQALMRYLKPRAAACIVEAEHLCMGCRGVSKPGGITVTSVMLGWFRSRPAARAELLALLGRGK